MTFVMTFVRSCLCDSYSPTCVLMSYKYLY